MNKQYAVICFDGLGMIEIGRYENKERAYRAAELFGEASDIELEVMEVA